MFQKLIPLCLFSIISTLIIGIAAREAIVNGDIAKNEQFPYYVALHKLHGSIACGGCIIGDKFILTAAHCFFKDGQIDKHHWIILAGTNNLNETSKPAEKIPVKKIFVPKSFKLIMAAGDDIAVLMLNHTLKYSRHIKKLELPQHKDENYSLKIGTIAGFGWDWVEVKDNKVVNGRQSDSKLRYTKVSVLDHCLENQTQVGISESIICGKSEQHDKSKPRGACRGDSGGPLVVGETVIGILSTGPANCNEKEGVSLYSRVSSHLELIHHAMNNKHHDDTVAVDVHF